jgi:hypothetical protein
MTILELDLEHRIAQSFDDNAVLFNECLFRHTFGCAKLAKIWQVKKIFYKMIFNCFCHQQNRPHGIVTTEIGMIPHLKHIPSVNPVMHSKRPAIHPSPLAYLPPCRNIELTCETPNNWS